MSCWNRYDRIPLPPPADLYKREKYGLQPDWVVFACPQSNFKIHPDFDVVLGRFVSYEGPSRACPRRMVPHCGYLLDSW
jgi:hypothetical protein